MLVLLLFSFLSLSLFSDNSGHNTMSAKSLTGNVRACGRFPLTSPLAEPRGCSLLGKNRACGALADPGYPLAGACDCASDSTRRTFFADSGCSVLASKLAGA